MLSVAGIDLLTLKEWQALMKWINQEVSDDPSDTLIISSMMFGDDYEFDDKLLDALDEEITYLESFEDPPDILVRMRERFNEIDRSK